MIDGQTTFRLSHIDYLTIEKWLETLDAEIATHTDMPKELRYGAIGGGLTYSFTPTNLGMIIKVTEYYTKKSLNLTEYDGW